MELQTVECLSSHHWIQLQRGYELQKNNMTFLRVVEYYKVKAR